MYCRSRTCRMNRLTLTALCSLAVLVGSAAVAQAGAVRVKIFDPVFAPSGTLTLKFTNDPEADLFCPPAGSSVPTTVCSVDVDCEQDDAAALALALVTAVNAEGCSGISAAVVDDPQAAAEFDLFMPDGVDALISDGSGDYLLRTECHEEGTPFLCGLGWVFQSSSTAPPQPPCADVSYCVDDDSSPDSCIFNFFVANCGGSALNRFFLDVEYGSGEPVTIADPAADITISGWTVTACFSETGANRYHVIFEFTGGTLPTGQAASGSIVVVPNGGTAQPIPGPSGHEVPANGIHTHVSPTIDDPLTCGPFFGPHLEEPGGAWSPSRNVHCDDLECGAGPGDVIFTEIMFDPNSPEAGPPFPAKTEWIEIYNPTDQPIDLSGWYTADEDGRSGDFPEGTMIPAQGIMVIIPRAHLHPEPLTKEQFSEAWSVSEDILIQPSAVNDASGPRPTNNNEGGIMGSGLSNSVRNDGNPANDLVNTPFGAPPCPYGQAYCDTGLATADNEVYLLVSPGPDGISGTEDDVIIDKVNVGASQDGWPGSNNSSSIMLLSDKLNHIDNDLGSNWKLTALSDAFARNNNDVAPFTGVDTGSPGRIEGVTVGNQPPSVLSQKRFSNPGFSETFELFAIDDGDGSPPGTLNVIITSLPDNGDLIDVANSNHVILAGELPYTAATNQVRYDNDGTCGTDTFTYRASDGELESGDATITIIVQCGEIVITEIMYDPLSTEVAPKVVEWVEVFNPSEDPLDVSGWRVRDRTGQTGEFPPGTIIDGLGVAVIIAGGRVDEFCTFDCPEESDCTDDNRTFKPADFEAAWGEIPQIIQPTIFGISCDATDTSFGELGGGGLANTPPAGGEELSIIDETGRAQDVVSYRHLAPWPRLGVERIAGSSIYLSSGGVGLPNYNAASNDVPANWRGAAPDNESGAFNNNIVGAFDAADTGSPGFLAGVSPGNTRPTPLGKLNAMQKNTSLDITLNVVDGTPTGTLHVIINSLPARDFPGGAAAGTLMDLGNNHVILAGDLPYTLVGEGNQVRFTPSTNLTGAVAFNFSGDDGELTSSTSSEKIAVQNNTVIITEIMYDPRNPEPANEWVEIRNFGASPVTVASIRAGRPFNIATVGSLNVDYELAPGERVLLVNGNSIANFATEWSLGAGTVIYVSPANWDALTQLSTTTPQTVVRLFDPGEGLLDEVIYESGTGGWPNNPTNSGRSFYLREALKPGPMSPSEYNDSGANWGLSYVDCDGAYESDNTDGIVDIGSPFIGSTNTADDCNNNGIPDDCDIAFGNLTDINPLDGIPDECQLACATCRGDMNGDGKFDGADIQLFVEAYIEATEGSGQYSPCADLNANFAINEADLSNYVNLLLNQDLVCNVATVNITRFGTPVAGALTVGFFHSAFPGPDVCGVEMNCPPAPLVCSVSVNVLVSDTAAGLAIKIAAAVNEGTSDCYRRITANQVGATVTFHHENPRRNLTLCLSTPSDNSPGMGYNLGGDNACGVNNVLDGVAGNEADAQGANGFRFTGSSNN
jgi:hypothetical protein